MCEAIRVRHLAYSTEQPYIYITDFIRFHNRKRPRDLGLDKCLPTGEVNLDFATVLKALGLRLRAEPVRTRAPVAQHLRQEPRSYQ
ncbi:hypothetical protein [Meiothermus sp. Pnk-1]|uniref:phage integrase N-terminal SAM-like domain-containing protein n=1 Tax=unclassified Meiothermus TaxID=370471 RepID=UPI00351A48E1